MLIAHSLLDEVFETSDVEEAHGMLTRTYSSLRSECRSAAPTGRAFGFRYSVMPAPGDDLEHGRPQPYQRVP